jgi:nicotinamide mononucleotide adenylyltransferase
MFQLKKALVFIKKFWWVPATLFAAGLIWVFTKKTNIIDWKRMLNDAIDAHNDEVNVIERVHKEKVDAIDRAIRRSQEAETKIKAEFEKNERVLDIKQEKRVKQIIKQLSDDPQALADALEKETGHRILILD